MSLTDLLQNTDSDLSKLQVIQAYECLSINVAYRSITKHGQ